MGLKIKWHFSKWLIKTMLTQSFNFSASNLYFILLVEKGLTSYSVNRMAQIKIPKTSSLNENIAILKKILVFQWKVFALGLGAYLSK